MGFTLNRERPKAHEDIPEGLGIGVFERRNEQGELQVYLKGNNTTSFSEWVTLGKYAKPRDDGRQFYVADRTKTTWAAPPITTYHEDLLMAVSRIMEIKLQWEERNGY
jgi:hypothetical protein